MTNKDKYKELAHLFGAYFHQDWDAEYSCPKVAISDFVAGVSLDSAKRACKDITFLLQSKASNSELKHIILNDLESYYLPTEDKATPRQWLEKVKKQIEDELHLLN